MLPLETATLLRKMKHIGLVFVTYLIIGTNSLATAEDCKISHTQYVYQSNMPQQNYIIPTINPFRAAKCDLMTCLPQAKNGSVCGLNMLFGKVASFKNRCDLYKHNCKYGTEFRVILREVCPWEITRRVSQRELFDYTHEKYYNDDELAFIF